MNRIQTVIDSKVILALTPAQHPIWLGHQIDPLSPAYNVASYIDIAGGTLDVSLLASALYTAVRETDALRVRIVEHDNGVQKNPVQIIEADATFAFDVIDLATQPDPVGSAQAWMKRDVAVRFDLGTSPLISTSLLRLDGQRHWCYVKTHHIAMDGYALSMFIRRLADVYTALVQHEAVKPSPFLPLQALVDSEQAYKASDAFEADRAYWMSRCAGLGDVPSFCETTAQPSFKALQHKVVLDDALVRKLSAAGEQASTHWVSVVIAGFAGYLSRYTGCSDVVIGVPLLNRLESVAARVPSTMANVLPLQLSIRPADTMAQLLDKVERELAGMKAHQRYRAEDVRRDCNLVGAGRRLTGPQINIDIFTDPLTFGRVPAHAHVLAAGPADDLSIVVQAGQLAGQIQLIGLANPALYTEQTLATHLQRFTAFLDRFSEDLHGSIGRLDASLPQELDFFFAPRRHPQGPQAGAGEHDRQTLVRVFEARAAATPDAIALSFNGEHLSYCQLDLQANQLAHHLADAAGASSNRLVALLLPRSIDTVVSILAVLKCGFGYVPMDPDAPVSRLEVIISDTQPVLLITDRAHSETVAHLPYGQLLLDDAATQQAIAYRDTKPLALQGIGPRPGDLAYVIYTSGSTGVPKGVKITHHNVVRLFTSTDSWFGYRSDDVWTLCHSYIFDASIWEMWGALLHGSRLVIVPVETTRAPDELLKLVVQEQVTVFGQIPSAFYRFMEAEQDHPELSTRLKLRYQCFGGEALDLSRLKSWFAVARPSRPRLLNMYGITETTVNVTYQFVTESQVNEGLGSLIGKAYEDLEVMVLDDALRPVPIGHYGEMYVVGAGLSEGYLNRPDLDVVRFVANPYGTLGSRMYRSGDVAAVLPDHTLSYVGRADQQVKVKGYRIELGEIEAQLREHPRISDAVVSVRTDAAGDARLEAHVVLRVEHVQQAAIDVSELRDHLRSKLPSYMVPGAIGILASLPVSHTGKVDRRALPEIQSDEARHIEPARDELDETVLAVWCAHLALSRIGINDNFFDIGGDSIKAIRVCRELNIPVTELFEDPTPRAAADLIRHQQEGGQARRETSLHCFTRQSAGTQANLVLVPFAGGNALAYRELANELSGVFNCVCVNLPGHDPTQPEAAMMGIAELAEKAVEEIMTSLQGPIVVYGHCAGNAIAIAIARHLEQAGARLVELVIGGMLPDADPQDVQASVATKTGEDIIAFLRQLGGFKDVLDEVTLARISRMTKHDSVETAAFFADDACGRQVLEAPIRVVVGDQDPLTPDYLLRHLDWSSWTAGAVSLAVIEGGGHYFATDNARQLAAELTGRFRHLAPVVSTRAARKLREFANPFDDAQGPFLLLVNPAGQRSLWPVFAPQPLGWTVEHGPSTRDDCLAVALSKASLHQPAPVARGVQA